LIQRRSLRTKIITWSFIPTAIILLAVALVTFYAYQRVTEDLVIGRNQQLVRLAAGQLAADLAEHANLLSAVGRMSDIHGGDPAEQRAALAGARNRLVVFDGGVVVLNEHGTVTATEPERGGMHGQDWSSRPYFREVLRAGAPVFSNIIADGPTSAEVISVAVPLLGDRGEFRGTIVGMFRLGATSVSAFYGNIVKLRIAESGNSYLLDASHRIIYHSDVDRIGREISPRSPIGRLLERGAGELRTRDADGQEIVASFAPVPGTPWKLVTEENWEELMASSQGYRQFLLLLLGLGVVVPGLVVTFGVRRITGPIEKLIAASQEVAAGKFGQTIEVQTGDELEELAEQFNSMSAQLRESYADLEQKVADRTKELATINAVSSVVSRSLDVDEILQSALEHTSRALRVEAGGIYLLDEQNQALTIAAHRGLSPDFVAGIDGLKVGEGFSGRVVQTGQPLVVRDVLSDPRLPRMEVKELGPFSLASIPLSSKGRVLGTMFLAAPGGREFTEQDIQLLCSIGLQVGVAIENGLLYRRAQQLAVLEERNRLARDLHDSVTQAVYGVTLYAEAATRLLSAGQTEMASEHLRELRATAQQALREMRSLIYELRPPVLEKEGLVAALQARLEAVEGRAGVKTDLRLEGNIDLSRGMEEELYRIAQEALNNALKHARAQNIGLLLRRDETHLVLEIVDDGMGFEGAGDDRHGGLGLPGMRERAHRLGGSLTVLSSPGQGTTVRVEVPNG
jgi:signal transduction histidine kinase